jgi:hypothetical protein
MNKDLKPGVIVTVGLAFVLLAFALSVNFPKAAGGGFKGDEATYYVLGHSLAHDFDFAFTHDDLVRVWQEFPGPEGIFLKRGKAIDIQRSARFPFVRWVKLEDPQRDTRLYFSKSFIYPLAAAPFIFMFGTNGFLVLHALLISLDFLIVYLFLHARTKSNWSALPLAAVFLVASVVPVYFVWLMPELFNFSLALYALFFWSYKEVAGGGTERSDYMAGALLGILTFSKPTHAILMFPVVVLALSRRQWPRAVKTAVVWAIVTGALFAANVAITGEFNYQGGDRKTFYHTTGFPFANTWETFDNSGPVRGREDVMVGDVLVNSHSVPVFLHNIVYFTVGRYAGLVPYFFPGVLALVLFALSKSKPTWQWLVVGTIAGAVFAHLVMYPFTYNGGGGPLGNRYFIAFYPLFLLLMPATAGLGVAFTGLVVGALFTSTIVLNPFFASANPGEHAKSGPLRVLPIDLTLINDLPVAQHPERMKQPLGGTPPVLAYFPDDNAYNPEGDWFWVKGKSKAEVVLRAGVADAGQGRYISKKISKLTIDVRNAGVPNRIKLSAGGHTQTLDMSPGELRQISLTVGSGVPYRRDVQPTSYLYVMSISTTNGFVPFLDIPCEKPRACPSDDNRYLGAMIHVVPEYTDADISTWTAPGAVSPRKDQSGGLRDAP